MRCPFDGRECTCVKSSIRPECLRDYPIQDEIPEWDDFLQPGRMFAPVTESNPSEEF